MFKLRKTVKPVQHLHQKYRYSGDLKVDVELSEGNTKEARLMTIQTIENNWKKYINGYIKMLTYTSRSPGGVGPKDSVAATEDDSTFDEPYTLWLNTGHHKWLKSYPHLNEEL